MRVSMVRSLCVNFALFIVLGCFVQWVPSVMTARAEEGMFPVSELGTVDLATAGLNLTAEQIFSEDQICQVDGICRVNGCTGSFVSRKGLIITNHHCAYRAIQSSSTADQDLLTNGFHAGSLEREIPAKGYTVRITESFEDCSDRILSVVQEGMSALDRTKAIELQTKKIEQQAESEDPSIRAEVAEMFIGETYVLFRYTYLKDVRLVFAPPASVGNFGGEIDNWEWPRHTGDFSFMRAYTAPDGSSAEYSRENIPFEPKTFLQVQPAGVDEGDFVFLLGYPGRTARHKTAAFLKYERDVRLPAIVDLYQKQIEIMTEEGVKDRAVEIKHASRMRSLSNVEKRSRGQLKGLVRAKLVEARQTYETELQTFINADAERAKKYGTLLAEIEAVYDAMEKDFETEFEYQNLFSASRLFEMAFTIVDSAAERAKPDLERESAYMARNIQQTIDQILLSHADMDLATELRMMEEMRRRMGEEKSSENLNELIASTRLKNRNDVEELLRADQAAVLASDDIVIKLVIEEYPRLLKLREMEKSREGELARLYGELIEVKKEFEAKQFVPDANATLRLTYGHLKGYSPNDAIVMTPISTLRGVLEKTTGVEPFETPEKVLTAASEKRYGAFESPDLDSVPVAILYDTDTTGGNSGSPIMNGDGELVGVNFDRAFEATINDFAWNESYSRSIGVDIRYVLWITGVVYEANDLMVEMSVE